MNDPAPNPWPPAPIRTERLVLRPTEARDRPTIIDLFASPEVGTYVGGPQSREELERTAPEIPGQRFGFFVIELNGAMIGLITLDRRGPSHPGHVRPEGNETELGYMFLPHSWGQGYALEACTAVLDWVASVRPGEPVVLCTQALNYPSLRLAGKLGFTEVERFEDFGVEQWFGVLYPPPR